jgi:plasmid maintenance system antidote protein VapI
MQHQLPILSPVRAPERVPHHLVALCRSSGEAVLLAIRYGKKTQRQAASAVGIEPAQLARIIGGTAHMPADRALQLAYAVGNWGWQQWVAHACGFDLVPRVESSEERVMRLEAENAELRLGRAA